LLAAESAFSGRAEYAPVSTVPVPLTLAAKC